MGKAKKKKLRADLELHLTMTELIHLRDLMSILLPPDGSITISKSLAEIEDRELQEGRLYEKIYSLCSENGIPAGETAPDYYLNFSVKPSFHVLPLNFKEEVEEEDIEEDLDGSELDDEEEEKKEKLK